MRIPRGVLKKLTQVKADTTPQPWLLEFGFYSQKLKSAGYSTEELHKLYRKKLKQGVTPTKGEALVLLTFKDLYQKHCPNGVTFEQHEVNPQCSICKDRNTEGDFCTWHETQCPSPCEYGPMLKVGKDAH